ncbi:MAG: BON domain-containing protein, partial [Bdellovibrionota bacterium]
ATDYRATRKDEYMGRSNLGSDYRNLESDYETRGWDTDANTSSRYGRDFYANRGEASQFQTQTPSQQRESHYGRGPKNYRRSDDRIREDASEILERHHGVDASEIEVDVKDGIVTLRGHAEDRRQKRLAEDCVEQCAGVKDVRNELTINQSLFQRAKEALMGTQLSDDPNVSKVGERKRH